MNCFHNAQALVRSWPFQISILLLFSCVTQCDALEAKLLHRLTPPSPVQNAGFGNSVALNDRYIAVSQPQWADFENGVNNAGRVELFDLNSGQHVFTFNDPDLPDGSNIGRRFGRGLAISDDRLFIGASSLDETVYAFDLNSKEILWSTTNPAINGRVSISGFGRGLAYSDESLLATTALYQVPFVGSLGGGFTLDANDGSPTQFFENPEPENGDVIGSLRSFDTFDGKIALGSISDCLTAGASGGCVSVFDEVSGDLLFTLNNPTPKPLQSVSDLPDWFGATVDGNANLIAVGDRLDEANGERTGGVYLFDASTGQLQRALYSPNVQRNEEFGRDVGLTDEGSVWVGADGSEVNNLTDAGRVYLFDGNSGELVTELTSPSPQAGALFGQRVNVFRDFAAISATGEDAVYIYTQIPEPSSLALSFFLLYFLVNETRGSHVSQQKEFEASTRPRLSCPQATTNSPAAQVTSVLERVTFCTTTSTSPATSRSSGPTSLQWQRE